MTCQVPHSFQRPNHVKKSLHSFKYITQIPHQTRQTYCANHIPSSPRSCVPFHHACISQWCIYQIILYDLSRHFILFLLSCLVVPLCPPNSSFCHVALTSISITTMVVFLQSIKGNIVFNNVCSCNTEKRTQMHMGLLSTKLSDADVLRRLVGVL